MYLQLEQLQTQKDNEIISLKEAHQYEIKTLTEDKNIKIAMLMKKNMELTQWNEELINKVNMYLKIMNNRNNEKATMNQDLENQITQLKADKNDLIKYYENKLTYFNNNYIEDKNHIISSYENKIEQLRNDYMENKKKMQSLIEQREMDIKSLIDEHRNEIDKAKEEAENVKKTHFDGDQEYRI